MNATAPSALLWFVAGFGIWSVCFVLLYGVQAVGCEWGWHEAPLGFATLQHLILGAILVTHVVVLAVLSAIAVRWWRSDRENGAGRFVRASAVTLTLAALIATIWTGIPAVVLRACVG